MRVYFYNVLFFAACFLLKHQHIGQVVVAAAGGNGHIDLAVHNRDGCRHIVILFGRIVKTVAILQIAVQVKDAHINTGAAAELVEVAIVQRIATDGSIVTTLAVILTGCGSLVGLAAEGVDILW